MEIGEVPSALLPLLLVRFQYFAHCSFAFFIKSSLGICFYDRLFSPSSLVLHEPSCKIEKDDEVIDTPTAFEIVISNLVKIFKLHSLQNCFFFSFLNLTKLFKTREQVRQELADLAAAKPKPIEVIAQNESSLIITKSE